MTGRDRRLLFFFFPSPPPPSSGGIRARKLEVIKRDTPFSPFSFFSPPFQCCTAIWAVTQGRNGTTPDNGASQDFPLSFLFFSPSFDRPVGTTQRAQLVHQYRQGPPLFFFSPNFFGASVAELKKDGRRCGLTRPLFFSPPLLFSFFCVSFSPGYGSANVQHSEARTGKWS